MTSSTVEPAGTTVPASGLILTTVPGSWPVLFFWRNATVSPAALSCDAAAVDCMP